VKAWHRPNDSVGCCRLTTEAGRDLLVGRPVKWSGDKMVSLPNVWKFVLTGLEILGANERLAVDVSWRSKGRG